ncbi:MAG: FHA domain-containing protein [Anaerolineaceae bacterium]|nr:FHA domain-containing protein [Anaerolineaceae bacterium]
MTNYGTIQVVDRKGWSKSFPLEKALTMIGSAPFNDIVLSEAHGSGVAAVHLQLISTQTAKRGFRLINLVNEPLLLTLSNARGSLELQAKGSRELEDGDFVQLGDFRITFYLQTENGFSIEKSSENIGVKLEMPGVILRQGSKLTGLLTLKNFGTEKRSQFEIDLEGLPADCYQVDPAPLLYPGGEEKLQIRFFHLGNRPNAGESPIQIHVTAVDAYPKEKVILPVVLDIEPVYQYSLGVFDSLEAILEKNTINNRSIILENMDQRSTPYLESIERNDDAAMKSAIANEISTKENSEQGQIKLNESPTQKDEESEVDWWADNLNSVPKATMNDPLAGLKRSSKPKLSVEKSKIQVLKAENDIQTEVNEIQESE